jgi:3',5'-cyclic AMP phosphodiesterase CpdA
VGDVGDGSDDEKAVARAIADAHDAEPLDLLLLLGDLIYPDGEPHQYERKFARPYAPVLRAGIELLATLGNHDIRTDTEAIRRLFGMPANYFTVVRGPVEFFVLDTSRGRVDAAQVAWLEQVLQASTSPWKIAVMHVPLFSSSEYHGSNERLQTALRPVFERYDVQLVIAGHDHNYERTLPIGDVTYIVSGGGCCPREEGRSSLTADAEYGLHFVVFDVRRDVIRLSAKASNGRVIDTAEIPRVPAGSRQLQPVPG